MNDSEKMEIGADDIGAMPEMPEMPEMEEFFQKHFIRIDGRSRLVNFFSDAFDIPPPQGGEADILINERGGRHFRLILDGELSEENPAGLTRDEQGVPLLKWDAKNRKIARRTDKEIQADIDAIPAPEPAAHVEERIAELKKTVDYVVKAVDIIAGALPKAQQAQVMQVQKTMFGEAFNG